MGSLKEEIAKKQKQIKSLKGIESDIKWQIEREAKMIQKMNEKEKLKDEINWRKE